MDDTDPWGSGDCWEPEPWADPAEDCRCGHPWHVGTPCLRAGCTCPQHQHMTDTERQAHLAQVSEEAAR